MRSSHRAQRVAYFVDNSFAGQSKRIMAVIEQLLELNGWRGQPQDNPGHAIICYSDTQVPNRIPCAGKEAWSKESSAPVVVDGLTVPACARVVDGSSVDFDPLLAAFFLLSGQHEHDEEVVEHGRIPGEGLKKWGLVECPTVRLIAQRLLRYQPLLETIARAPRWPRGKLWALSLTHDHDRHTLFRPRFYLRTASQEWRKRRLLHATRTLTKALYSCVARATGRPDPVVTSWNDWRKLESREGIRGTYYIAVWSCLDADGDWRDVSYRHDNPSLRRMVAAMRDAGSEIGLHSSIGAVDRQRFEREVLRFESAFGFSPAGFRPHHWSLGSGVPEQALSYAAMSTGLEYCSALGMNRVDGYRRGLDYPYRVYDPVTDSHCGLWEVPPIMMDVSLSVRSESAADEVERFRYRRDRVRRTGGCLVLNWHTDSLIPGSVYRDPGALLSELCDTVGDSSCWVCTPSDLVRWARFERWQEVEASIADPP